MKNKKNWRKINIENIGITFLLKVFRMTFQFESTGKNDFAWEMSE